MSNFSPAREQTHSAEEMNELMIALGSKLISKGKVSVDEAHIRTDIESSQAEYLANSMMESIADLKGYTSKSMGYKEEVSSFVIQGFAENHEFHILVLKGEMDAIYLRLLLLHHQITPAFLAENRSLLMKIVGETLDVVKARKVRKYRSVFSVDSPFFRRLDGVYRIGKYTLMPCKITRKNQQLGCSNFALMFDVEALTRGVAEAISLREAKEFVAFLSCLTRTWMKLSHTYHGDGLKFGPSYCEAVERFTERNLETVFHVDSDADKGKFRATGRPDLKGTRDLQESLKLPMDTEDLTCKMVSLPHKEKEKFLNAVLSYQFAREVMQYPTVSMTSLVSAVESMMVGEVGSILKKFRMFFERNLESPLPGEIRGFLKRIYSRRSAFVHRALLGEGRTKGLVVGFPIGEDEDSKEYRDLRNELGRLEELVSITLVEWLRRF